MDDVSRIIVSFGLNAAWQAPVIVGAAALGCRIVPHGTPALRHIVWQGALSMSVLLPLLAAASSAAGIPGLDVASSDRAHRWLESSWRWPLQLDALTLQFLAASFVVMCLARLIHVVRGLWEVRRMRRRARPAGDAAIARLGRACSEAFGVPALSIESVAGLVGPATVGVLRPTILLPEAFGDQSDDDVALAALAHETAHISRGDYAINIADELLLCAFGPHPIASVLRRRLEQTREMACDDLAAAKVLGARHYARCLVRITADAHARRLRAPALGLTDGDDLKARVARMLSPDPRSSSPGSQTVWPAVLVTAAALVSSRGVVQPVVSPIPAPQSASTIVTIERSHEVRATSPVTPKREPLTRPAPRWRRNLPPPPPPPPRRRAEPAGDARFPLTTESTAEEPFRERTER